MKRTHLLSLVAVGGLSIGSALVTGVRPPGAGAAETLENGRQALYEYAATDGAQLDSVETGTTAPLVNPFTAADEAAGNANAAATSPAGPVVASSVSIPTGELIGDTPEDESAAAHDAAERVSQSAQHAFATNSRSAASGGSATLSSSSSNNEYTPVTSSVLASGSSVDADDLLEENTPDTIVRVRGGSGADVEIPGAGSHAAPLPAAAGPGLAILIGWGLRRRRRES